MKIKVTVLIFEETTIYLNSRPISKDAFYGNMRALITRCPRWSSMKVRAVRMRSAKLRNHFNIKLRLVKRVKTRETLFNNGENRKNTFLTDSVVTPGALRHVKNCVITFSALTRLQWDFWKTSSLQQYLIRLNLIYKGLKVLEPFMSSLNYIPSACGLSNYADMFRLNANERHSPYDRHHKVSWHIKVHQNTHDFVQV